MKKFIAVILTLVTVVTSFCAFGATGALAEKLYKYKGYVYSLRSNGTVYISDYTGSKDGVVKIAEKIKGRKVEAIGYLSAFNNKKTKKIVIPRYVKIISDKKLHFYNVGTKFSVAKENEKFSSYKGMLMTKSKKTLYCVPYTDANTFTVPSTVVNIGASAFKDFACDTKKEKLTIKLPKGLKRIGAHAFASLKRLKSIKLPDKLESVGNGAFEDSLVDFTERISEKHPYFGKVTIPKSVTSIGEYAFGRISDDEDDGYLAEAFLIRGYKGTAAEKYATAHKLALKLSIDL